MDPPSSYMASLCSTLDQISLTGEPYKMAERPVYIPKSSGPLLVKTEMVPFQWFPGMAVSQKQKSIAALHEAAIKKNLFWRPL